MLNTKDEQIQKDGIGVIVGRFHVPSLTEGHVELFDSVIERHHAVVVVLGVSAVKATKTNPLEFEARRKMIQEKYPDITVVYVDDCPSNKKWVKNLDQVIDKHTPPSSKITLYGSRESFLEVYKNEGGRYKWVALEPNKIISGTTAREIASLTSGATEDFRKGVIWATQNQFDKVHPTVDIAVFKRDEYGNIEKVLFALKNHNEGKLMFIGGFADPRYQNPVDGDFYEWNARRELKEEAGIEAKDLVYIGSYFIDDWRYSSGKDKIATMFFVGEMTTGNPEPNDDIDGLEWVSVEDIIDIGWTDKGMDTVKFTARMAGGHKYLLHALVAFLKKERVKEQEKAKLLHSDK